MGHRVVDGIDNLPAREEQPAERTSKQHWDDHKDYFGSVVGALKIIQRIRLLTYVTYVTSVNSSSNTYTVCDNKLTLDHDNSCRDARSIAPLGLPSGQKKAYYKLGGAESEIDSETNGLR
ncbi:hypothetical protein PAMP_001716 [Pampus punctatissimus]